MKWVRAEEGELINLANVRTIDISVSQDDPDDCSVVAYSGDPCLAGNCHTIYDGTREECAVLMGKLGVFIQSSDVIYGVLENTQYGRL